MIKVELSNEVYKKLNEYKKEDDFDSINEVIKTLYCSHFALIYNALKDLEDEKMDKKSEEELIRARIKLTEVGFFPETTQKELEKQKNFLRKTKNGHFIWEEK